MTMNTSDNEDRYQDYSWNEQDPEEIQDLLLSGGPDDDDDYERVSSCKTCERCEQEFEHDDEHVCKCKCEDKRQDSDDFCLDCGHELNCFISDEDWFKCPNYENHRKFMFEEKNNTNQSVGKSDLNLASPQSKALIVELSRIRKIEKTLKLESEKLRKQILAEALSDTNKVYDPVDGVLLAWIETKEGLRVKRGCRQVLEREHPEIVNEFFENYSTTYLKLRQNFSK